MNAERHQAQTPSVHKRPELDALFRLLSLIEKRSPILEADLIKFLTSEPNWTDVTPEELSALLVQLAEAGYITNENEWISIAEAGLRFLKAFQREAPSRVDAFIACETRSISSGVSPSFEVIPGAEPRYSKRPSRDPDILASATPSLRPKTGWLVENIPRRMRAYLPEETEVRISPDFSREFRSGLRGGGSLNLRRVSITAAMSVKLVAPGGGFSITAQSPETQWVDGSNEDIAAWRFTITPLRRGSHTLSIMLSYRMVGAMGLIADTALPDQTINILVRTNVARTSMRAAAWAFTLCAGALLGSYAQEMRDYLSALPGWHLFWPGPENENVMTPKIHDRMPN